MLRNKLKYVVIDVDGTMTNAGIYYDELGNELKKFCTRDAAAFFVAKKLGINIIVLTGRECNATERRMKEMDVTHLFQNVKDKSSFLREFMIEHQLKKEDIGYIGDDLNDLAPMQLAGYKACPADSCKEIKALCDYISEVRGGSGAVRDIFENSLCIEQWRDVVNDLYYVGI
jgi:3-deoxy-D-manno-octulosonate 8-phosphate phosphatase (KDO 8-P phosphatase)